jgi:hypothetical protein
VKEQKSKPRKARRTLYLGAKISDYQFKRVLMAFVMDKSVAVAASHIALSANSIQAIYAKLRDFFCELTIFEDIYQGGDPELGIKEADSVDDALEDAVLEFHLARMKDKKLQKDVPRHEIDPHFAESCWRYQYHVMEQERPGERIAPMMFAHLLDVIKECGPVGRPPTKQAFAAALDLKLNQLNQRIRWLSRNAPSLKSEEARQTLHEILEINPKPAKSNQV